MEAYIVLGTQRCILFKMWLLPQKAQYFGTSLAVQWLGHLAFTAEAAGSIPGWETEIPQAAQLGQNKKASRRTHSWYE